MDRLIGGLPLSRSLLLLIARELRIASLNRYAAGKPDMFGNINVRSMSCSERDIRVLQGRRLGVEVHRL